ncbi:MerR family transcriptional regulator [Bacillus carboniphilus]|uniref:MerR family transcriptional regulator n=1 Tax=Bacillus carboniphilus TaxID=86663 RepID=A0ABY9JUC7_9BACI|nr:MerR family transcriptional regulator [Bacillus carboniphilus]WLR42985.1 MerR family transcriptional regulator [Bacillus carboniphilus]
MRIGELSKETGASIRSLRYYEQKQLIQAQRSPNGYRIFDVDTVQRVKLIQLYLGLGLNTDQIIQLLSCKDDDIITAIDDPSNELIHAFQQKLNQVNNEITTLLGIKERLEGVVGTLKRKGVEKRC